MPLESAIVSSILGYLNGLKGCIAEKVHGNAFQSGRPDINACLEGQLYRIEVKTPDHGNEPTKLQLMNLKKWAKAGAICVVVWSLDEVKNLIKHCYNTGFTGWYIHEDGQITKGGHK